MIKERIQKGLRPAFERDRVICRLIAAWSVFVILVLAGAFTDGKPDFTLLAFAQQVSLFHLLWCTALFFLLFSCVAVLIPAWHTDSWFMFAGATVCVLIWLSAYPTSQNGTLFVLACFAVYALFVISTLHRNEALLDRWRPSARTVTILAVAGGVLSCIVISAITCLRYRTFSAPNFDFGLFCNMFHNMREKGLPLVTSERDRLLSHFAVHISPIYYLLLPFYFVFPSPLTLQIGQAVVLTSGVIPVILLARHYRLSGKVTLLVSLLYSFYPAMSTGCFYDIHENCFLLPILLWLFYFFEREKYLPMYISAVLMLLVKEDAAVYLIFFAIYVLLSRRRYLHGAVLCAMAIAYFVLSAYLLNTFGLGMMVNRFDNLIYDKESGLLGAVRTAFFNPGYLLTQMFTTDGGTWQKLEYLIILLLPLAAIPFCTRKGVTLASLRPASYQSADLLSISVQRRISVSFRHCRILILCGDPESCRPEAAHTAQSSVARRRCLLLLLRLFGAPYALYLFRTLGGRKRDLPANGRDSGHPAGGRQPVRFHHVTCARCRS